MLVSDATLSVSDPVSWTRWEACLVGVACDGGRGSETRGWGWIVQGLECKLGLSLPETAARVDRGRLCPARCSARGP